MTTAPNYDWVVVGSQFAATVGAYLAVQTGARVAIVDQNTTLCSSMRGKRWGDFQLDFGCQMFSSYGSGEDDPVYEILNGKVVWLQRHLASVSAGQTTDGFEFPDLSAYGAEVSGRILSELIEAATHEPGSPASMAETLDQRYGATAANLISKITHDTYGIDTQTLAPEAYRMLPFARLVLVSDAAARLLKTIESLDDRIAARDIVSARTAEQGPVYYPANGGIATFCDLADAKLRDMNVAMMLGREITQLQSDGTGAQLTLADGEVLKAERILWATDPDQLAAKLGWPSRIIDQIHPVALVAYYFDISSEQAGPYTYLQSFDNEDTLFRASVPGSFAKGTCPPGRTYACGEVLTDRESEVWKHPSGHATRIWQEMLDHGVVTGAPPRDTHIVSAPVSYSFPKTGYAAAFNDLRERLSSMPDIHLVGRTRIGRHETVTAIRELISAPQ